MRIAYSEQIPRLSHIATPNVPELIYYTLCGAPAVEPGPVLSTSVERWPGGAELAAPWCPACHQQAIDSVPQKARIRYIGPAALVALIADTLEEDGVTVSWSPPREPAGLVDIEFRVTGTRIAVRTAVADVRKGVGTRGTVRFDSERRHTEAAG
jgi:hypothetical protein